MALPVTPADSTLVRPCCLPSSSAPLIFELLSSHHRQRPSHRQLTLSFDASLHAQRPRWYCPGTERVPYVGSECRAQHSGTPNCGAADLPAWNLLPFCTVIPLCDGLPRSCSYRRMINRPAAVLRICRTCCCISGGLLRAVERRCKTNRRTGP